MAGQISRRDFIGGLVGAGVAAGAGFWWLNRGGSDSTPGPEPGATVQLSQLPADVAARYRYVQSHQELAKHVPCYCGCGQAAGHRSLQDCFINTRGELDEHASGCDICLEIARDIEQYEAQGADLPTIRSRVDASYRRYGAPTNTE